MTGLDWRLRWETELGRADRIALAGMMARYYPENVAAFRGERAWYSARPEGRIVGYEGSRPVAHLGFLRRVLRIEGTTEGVLVADSGLVGVDPEFQGAGYGRELLRETVAVFRDLAVPFGFLTCAERVVPYYEAGGWQRVPNQITRLIGTDNGIEDYAGPAMVLPVASSIEDWPLGRTLIREGLEV